MKVEEIVLDGIAKEVLGGEDLKDKTKALEFKPRRGRLFDVEVTEDGNDFIFHFFPPTTEEFWRIINAVPSREFATEYWENLFPNALDVTARLYFKAEAPRLEATHMVQADCTTQFDGTVRPLDSWWMRARGFVNNTLDPDAFAERFYLALEGALVSRKRM